MATGYTYSPLNAKRNEIRVLCFDLAHDPKAEEILECRIEHISLGAIRWPIYYAVSYVWGDARKRKDMLIDGQLVNVPENAEIALRRLYRRAQGSEYVLTSRERIAMHPAYRPKSFTKTKKHARALRRTIAHGTLKGRVGRATVRMWLDAICINRSDLAERGEQTAMMGRLYSRAKGVLIWLGEGTEMTRPAMDSLDIVVAWCRSDTNGFIELSEQIDFVFPRSVSDSFTFSGSTA